MEFGAEFFVLLGFLVFVGGLFYLGVHRMVLKALDARGEAIASELAQAAKLRQEATALLASFEKKTAEAEANAAAIVAEARSQAEQLAADAAIRMEDFIARRTRQAEAKIAFAEVPGRRGRSFRRRRPCGQGGRSRAARSDAGPGRRRSGGPRDWRTEESPQLRPSEKRRDPSPALLRRHGSRRS